ncbi:MAG: hypothetical protein PHS20_02325 [Sphaerochaetaceae bacterium]|nr:hypothetical protein [Sphaerochaetaceae bacterium]
MKIIEKYLLGKTGNPELCEDGIVITDAFAAVIDGATSTGASSFCNGKRSGRVAMELVSKAIESLKPECNQETAVKVMNNSIMDFYQKQNVISKVTEDPRLRCYASAVLYSSSRREIWFIGDSQALIDGKRFCYEDPSDEIFQKLRAFLIAARIQSKETTYEKLLEHDTVRDEIYPLMNYQTFLNNSSYRGAFRFSSLNGFPIEPEFLRCIKIGQTVHEIVLASDGYPFLMPTFEESEKRLSSLLVSDPLLCSDFMATKGCMKGNLSFDDRSYIRLEP